MRRSAIPFIALAFIISAAGAAPAAHAQSCSSENPCPDNFRCATLVGTQGFCEPLLPASPPASAEPAQLSPAGFGNTNPPAGIGNSSQGRTGSNVTLINPLQGGSSLESFLLNILSFVINIGSIVVVLMLVYVGFKFVTAQGEPGKISEARDMLLWTVIGALVLLGSKAIAMGIQATVQALSSGG